MYEKPSIHDNVLFELMSYPDFIHLVENSGKPLDFDIFDFTEDEFWAAIQDLEYFKLLEYHPEDRLFAKITWLGREVFETGGFQKWRESVEKSNLEKLQREKEVHEAALKSAIAAERSADAAERGIRIATRSFWISTFGTAVALVALLVSLLS